MVSSFCKLLLLQAMLTAYGSAVAACSVAPGSQADDIDTGVKRAFRESAAVFTGKVSAIDYVRARPAAGDGRQAQVVRVAAQSWWKGAAGPMVAIHTRNHRHVDGMVSVEAHEYRYEVGQTYLIYAQAEDDGLHADGCTRTKRVGEAAGDIAVLDALKAKPE